MPRIIDLSRALENDIPADPAGFQPAIRYFDHSQGAEEMSTMFPGLRKEQLPNGEGWAVERIEMTTHNGTHVDAPWHFASTMNGGERAWTIDEVPLDWFYRPGVKLDFRDAPHGHVVSAAEVETALVRTGHLLKPFDIVLMNTSASDAYGTPNYLGSGCGFGREATLWLLERGVRVTGTDAWSWDAPFSFTRRRFAESGDPRIIWEGHKAGMAIGYSHIEKLANLHLLPATGFRVCCFPFKIKSASAGYTRAVAILNEEGDDQ
jgi:kynurenine formamidase